MSACVQTRSTRNGGVPSLRDLCVRRLLTSLYEGPAGDHNSEYQNSNHDHGKGTAEGPLLIEHLESGAIHAMADNQLGDIRLLARLDAVRKSLARSWANWAHPPLENESSSGKNNNLWSRPSKSSASLDDSFLAKEWGKGQSLSWILAHDDAALNPVFNRCPGRKHWRSVSHGSCAERAVVGNHCWPEGRYIGPYFLDPVEEGIEWVSHVAGVDVVGGPVQHPTTGIAGAAPEMTQAAAQGRDENQAAHIANEKIRHDGPRTSQEALVPLAWRGCSRGCLDFLDD